MLPLNLTIILEQIDQINYHENHFREQFKLFMSRLSTIIVKPVMFPVLF